MENLNYEFVYSVSELELKNKLDKNKILFFDTETIGLYGEVTLLQIKQKGNCTYLIKNPDILETVVAYKNYTLGGFNLPYDLTTFQRQLSYSCEFGSYVDLFYLSRLHYFNSLKHTLESVLCLLLGFNPYGESDKKSLQKSD